MARGRRRTAPVDNAPPEEPRETSNSKARAETIRRACREISGMQAEIQKIQADISEYKSTHIKGDLGMKASDFNVILRAYKLEDDDRDRYIDAIREGFAALGIGGQGDMFSALRPDTATANQAPAE